MPRSAQPDRPAAFSVAPVRLFLAGVLLVGIGVVMVQAMRAEPDAAAIKAANTAPPTTPERFMVISRLGLRPDTLAAAGLTAEQVRVMLRDLDTAVDEHIVPLRELTSSLSALAGDVTRQLEQRVAQGDRTVQTLDRYEQLTQDRQVTGSRVQTLDRTLFDAATHSFGDQERQTLRTIIANRQQHKLPVQYLLRERVPAEAGALSRAIRQERAMQTGSRQIDPKLIEFKATIDAQPDVTRARQALDEHSEPITAVFEQRYFKDRQDQEGKARD